MSDFHASLDRALDPDPHTDWGITPEALLLSSGKVMPAIPNLTALMDRINRDVSERVARINFFAYRRPIEYDDSWLPRDESFIERHDPAERYYSPERYYSNEWIQTLLGPMPFATPLCDQELPAEGVE